jgi:hypothetical protein
LGSFCPKRRGCPLGSFGEGADWSAAWVRLAEIVTRCPLGLFGKGVTGLPLGIVWPNGDLGASLGSVGQNSPASGEPRAAGCFRPTGFATDWSFETENGHNRSERKNRPPCKQQEKYRRIFNRKASRRIEPRGRRDWLRACRGLWVRSAQSAISAHPTTGRPLRFVWPMIPQARVAAFLA